MIATASCLRLSLTLGYALGAVLTAALSIEAIGNPLVSMTRYTAGLMMLNQLTPPLFLLACSTRGFSSWLEASSDMRGIVVWLHDPWVAGTVFAMVSVIVSYPAVLDPALANALFSAPLGLVEFLTGLLVWAQILPAIRCIRRDWQAGLFAIGIGIPMNVVAVVWMMSPRVIYAPYLDVICLWNFTPLQDQQWAGFIMFLAGVPLQLRGAWLLLNLSAKPSG